MSSRLKRQATIARFMKFLRLACFVATSFCLLRSVYGQGFQNLDFEDAVVQDPPPNSVPTGDAIYDPIDASAALPYWTALEDNTVCTAIWGAPNALDETSAALVSDAPIAGDFSVMLSSYTDAPSNLFKTASISQTGYVPEGTRSIKFLIGSPSQAGPLNANPVVMLNGTVINTFQQSTSGGVATMVGDVSAFAGKTAQLTFQCSGAGLPSDENYFILDSISFSSSAVPEPSVFGLLALGGLFSGLFRFKRLAAKLV
jgi:hypothetical protein